MPNHYHDLDGTPSTLKALTTKYALPYPLLWKRLNRYDWPLERALLTPVRSRIDAPSDRPNPVDHRTVERVAGVMRNVDYLLETLDGDGDLDHLSAETRTRLVSEITDALIGINPAELVSSLLAQAIPRVEGRLHRSVSATRHQSAIAVDDEMLTPEQQAMADLVEDWFRELSAADQQRIRAAEQRYSAQYA